MSPAATADTASRYCLLAVSLCFSAVRWITLPFWLQLSSVAVPSAADGPASLPPLLLPHCAFRPASLPTWPQGLDRETGTKPGALHPGFLPETAGAAAARSPLCSNGNSMQGQLTLGSCPLAVHFAGDDFPSFLTFVFTRCSMQPNSGVDSKRNCSFLLLAL